MPNYFTTVMNDSPWVYYRFGESSGTNATDSSGNSRTGTISATGITYSQTGAIKSDPNTAFLFASGSSGLVTLPSTNPFTGSSASTMECWFKVAALPGSGVFFNLMQIADVAGGAGHSSTVYLAGTQSGKIFWDDQSASTSWGTIPSTNTYYHVVLTYAGGSGGAVILYVNGSNVGSTTATLSINSGFGPKIGGGANATIDEVAFYTTVLSSTRVSAHYNAGIATLAYPPVSDGMGGMFV